VAGEWPQETGQCHGSACVSLEKHDEARLERENQVIKRQQPLTLSSKNGTGGELSRFPGAGRLPPIVGGDVDDVEIEELGHQALVFKESLEPPLLHLGKFGFGGDITERLPGRALSFSPFMR